MSAFVSPSEPLVERFDREACRHSLAQTTFPPVVTIPNSLTFTSMTVPFVMTPSCVYSGD